MEEFRVAEHFLSVNGEGPRSGQLALFIRFAGCNLNCTYCDTEWANRDCAGAQRMTTEELLDTVRGSGIRNVTLTGGEPLIQEGIGELLTALAKEPRIRVEIETNGSVSLKRFAVIGKALSFNMDYKLPGSGMEDQMCTENFALLAKKDTVKFVVTDRRDLERGLEMIKKYALTEKCRVFFSPVYGKMQPEEIVDFMKAEQLNDVTLQLQIHKLIWDGSRHGV